MLRKKGIKSNATDGPITKHPRFGRIQWNQSCSHMPHVALDPEPKMMDMDEPIAPEPTAPEPVEPEEEDQQEEEEYEESITIRASDFAALQDTLEDI
jgi:hypothetical protein